MTGAMDAGLVFVVCFLSLPEACALTSTSLGEVIGLLCYARNDDRVSSWH